MYRICLPATSEDQYTLALHVKWHPEAGELEADGRCFDGLNIVHTILVLDSCFKFEQAMTDTVTNTSILVRNIFQGGLATQDQFGLTPA